MTIVKALSLCFMLLCAAVMVGNGVWQWRMDRPAPFWSDGKAPGMEEIKSVAVYNRLHGLLWIVFGGTAAAALLMGSDFSGRIVLGGSLVMLLCHKCIWKCCRR